MSTALAFVRAIELAEQVKDGTLFQRRLMWRLMTLLRQRVGAEQPATIECSAEFAIAALFPLQLLRVQFAIGHWTMVRVVEEMAQSHLLRIEQAMLKQPDGLRTFGLLGLVKAKPAIAVTAAREAETLFVQVGGFDRSILVDIDQAKRQARKA